MAIAAQGGTSANNSGNVSSLALPSYSTTTGRVVVMAIALGSTSSSVSSISSSAGSYSWVLKASKNGSGVRTEVWESPVTTGAATVFTVNITGGATSVAAALEEYSGASGTGNTDTSSGNTQWMRGSISMTDGNDWTVSAFGFVCQSGDTLANDMGSSRQNSVPAATAVGISLTDDTMVIAGTLNTQTEISNVRQWASATVELLVSGGAAISAVDYAAVSAPAGSGQPTWQTGHPDLTYDHFLEPLFAQQQTYPPAPGANNYGFVA